MTCLLYELPYMRFLFEYHILTFLESVPYLALLSTVQQHLGLDHPRVTENSWLCLTEVTCKSSISSTTGLQISNTRYSTFGTFSSSESPTTRTNTTEQTKCLHPGGSSERSPEPVRWRLVLLGLMVRTYLTYLLPTSKNKPANSNGED